MTDFEKLKEVFTSLGIACSDELGGVEIEKDVDSIYIEEGYSGFYTVFNFDKKTGKLKSYGAYE